MIITGMDHFQSVCKKKLVEWYHKNRPEIDIGIYAEYTYNGDKQELYEDVYKKLTNTCHTEE